MGFGHAESCSSFTHLFPVGLCALAGGIFQGEPGGGGAGIYLCAGAYTVWSGDAPASVVDRRNRGCRDRAVRDLGGKQKERAEKEDWRDMSGEDDRAVFSYGCVSIAGDSIVYVG